MTITPDLDALRAAGLSEARVGYVRGSIQRIDAALRSVGAAAPSMTMLVPGRIEVFGKHTDYCGGESLLCAVDRGFVVRVAPRPDPVVRVIDVGRRGETALPLRVDASAPMGSWGNYVATVVRRLTANFPEAVRGCDIGLISDLPSAAGLSSSSALIITCAKALVAANALDRTPAYLREIGTIEDEAAYFGTIENGADFGGLVGTSGVGTFGGSEDHAAILGARPHALLRMAFAPTRRRGLVPVPTDLCFVIAVSGVVADKTGAARDRYNAVATLARRLVDLWNTSTGDTCASLAAVLDRAPDAGGRLHTIIGDLAEDGGVRSRLQARLAHFRHESEVLLPAASDALARADLAAFGDAADASHQAAGALLHNQVPATDALQRLARANGAIAASAFGAGFGGSVWALLPRADAARFAVRWLATYRAAHPERAARASTFVTDAGPALQRW